MHSIIVVDSTEDSDYENAIYKSDIMLKENSYSIDDPFFSKHEFYNVLLQCIAKLCKQNPPPIFSLASTPIQAERVWPLSSTSQRQYQLGGESACNQNICTMHH